MQANMAEFNEQVAKILNAAVKPFMDLKHTANDIDLALDDLDENTKVTREAIMKTHLDACLNLEKIKSYFLAELDDIEKKAMAMPEPEQRREAMKPVEFIQNPKLMKDGNLSLGCIVNNPVDLEDVSVMVREKTKPYVQGQAVFFSIYFGREHNPGILEYCEIAVKHEESGQEMQLSPADLQDGFDGKIYCRFTPPFQGVYNIKVKLYGVNLPATDVQIGMLEAPGDNATEEDAEEVVCSSVSSGKSASEAPMTGDKRNRNNQNNQSGTEDALMVSMGEESFEEQDDMVEDVVIINVDENDSFEEQVGAAAGGIGDIRIDDDEEEDDDDVLLVEDSFGEQAASAYDRRSNPHLRVGKSGMVPSPIRAPQQERKPKITPITFTPEKYRSSPRIRIQRGGRPCMLPPTLTLSPRMTTKSYLKTIKVEAEPSSRQASFQHGSLTVNVKR